MPFFTHSHVETIAEAKHRAIKELIDNSLHSKDFYVLLVGAVLLAAGGIFADSIPVLIASMIVAPLAFPILALGLGITVGDMKLVGRVLGLLFVSCLLALGLAALMTIIFNNERVKDIYVTFTENQVLAVGVAVIAGAIAAYGTVRQKVATAITGVAIAVSLMPPLVATGIGFASNDQDLTSHALTLFLLNVAGILVASIATFTLFGMRKIYRTAR